VLAVLLFAVFWVVLGLGVFFLGVRVGPGAGQGKAPGWRARRAMGWTMAVVYLAFGVAIPVLIQIGNRNNANAQVGGSELTQAEKHGRELFGEHCGLCHTLAAANAVGKVGPNLDQIQPTEQLVLHTIQYGCLQNPPSGSQEACLGEGTMPADVLQGVDATDVAKFVSKVAGNE
jgi:mono/diheme cytochrome c family protein